MPFTVVVFGNAVAFVVFVNDVTAVVVINAVPVVDVAGKYNYYCFYCCCRLWLFSTL